MIDDHGTDDEAREVYARFGLAVYCAQVLEHGLVNAMFLLKFVPEGLRQFRGQEQWEKDVDAFFETNFEPTMGRMMRSLRELVEVPDDLEQMLVTALKKRNWLAHGFFRDRAVEFMSPSGRAKMLAELEDCRSDFRKLDDCLSTMIRPLCEKYGLTDERLAEEYSAMLRESISGD